MQITIADFAAVAELIGDALQVGFVVPGIERPSAVQHGIDLRVGE